MAGSHRTLKHSLNIYIKIVKQHAPKRRLLGSIKVPGFCCFFNSWLYRHVRGWQCEECQLSLNLDRQYLHTHHISGTQHNDPKDLRALCIACHSGQPGENHRKLKTTDDYHTFMEKYGPQWCEARKSVESRVPN